MNPFIVISESKQNDSDVIAMGPFVDQPSAIRAMVQYAKDHCGLDSEVSDAEYIDDPFMMTVSTGTHQLRAIGLDAEWIPKEVSPVEKVYRTYQIIETKPEKADWHPTYWEKIQQRWESSIDDDGDRVLWFRAESEEKVKEFLNHELFMTWGFTLNMERVTIHECGDDFQPSEEDGLDFDQERLESRIPVCSDCFSPDVTHDAAVAYDPGTKDWSELVSVYDNSDCQRCECECSITMAYPEEVKHEE